MLGRDLPTTGKRVYRGKMGVKGGGGRGGGANFRFRIVVRQRWRLCKIRGECREQIM